MDRNTRYDYQSREVESRRLDTHEILDKFGINPPQSIERLLEGIPANIEELNIEDTATGNKTTLYRIEMPLGQFLYDEERGWKYRKRRKP